MSSAAALSWFARHEIRLAWREWLAMMTAGRRLRKRSAIVGLIVFAAMMHLPAYAVVGRFANLAAPLDKSALIVITATIFLAWALMLSQAIESVTRVFYARADLDLIMSSPAALANVFSVRIAAIALTVTAMALVLSTPFVDVLVIGAGPTGMACAIEAQRAGFRSVLVDKGCLCNSLFHYPSHMTFFTTSSSEMPSSFACSGICLSTNGVRTKPGQITFARTPCAAPSLAITRARPSSPCLAVT